MFFRTCTLSLPVLIAAIFPFTANSVKLTALASPFANASANKDANDALRNDRRDFGGLRLAVGGARVHGRVGIFDREGKRDVGERKAVMLYTVLLYREKAGETREGGEQVLLAILQ